MANINLIIERTNLLLDTHEEQRYDGDKGSSDRYEGFKSILFFWSDKENAVVLLEQFSDGTVWNTNIAPNEERDINYMRDDGILITYHFNRPQSSGVEQRRG